MTVIAQLIKLRDYISRYEWDVIRYPSQFIRIKKENYDRLYHLWSEQDLSKEEPIQAEENKTIKKSLFKKFVSLVKREENHEEEIVNKKQETEALPQTKDELIHYFLDKLFKFQLKWATSTISHISFVDKKYYHDPLLKYLLQRFPDNYLTMYFPIFNIRKAPIDCEIVWITPIGIEILHFIEAPEEAIIIAGDDRTWRIESKNTDKKILNPIIALKRSENIINGILHTNQIDFPITRTIISRTNRILFHTEPYNVTIIDKLEYPNWFRNKRALTSPLKSRQLKVADVLLKQCVANSVKRPEWEDENEESFYQTMDD